MHIVIDTQNYVNLCYNYVHVNALPHIKNWPMREICPIEELRPFF